ncbi:MAG TPA: hypothetical protein VFQ53_37150 [Kofleriaceae bacterium]|nr:hypothetical protein [Kofleriaceae bacterium]
MIPHTPLDPVQLSPAAKRALGPGPGKLMAARGLMPLPPGDQVAVLYQLSIDGDANIVQFARATAAGLPDKLLAGTLSDPGNDPRVLDLFAELAADKPAVFDAIVLNPVVADETIATLATRAGSREVDLIAENEQRLLRHPAIIAAMYMNRRARMSTIDRVVELAVRNHVRVPGLAAWDEVARALTGSMNTGSVDDAVFENLVTPRDDTALTHGDADQVLPEDAAEQPAVQDNRRIPFRELTVPQKIRAATLGDAFIRSEAIRDPLRMVQMAAIKSPGVTEVEASRYASNQALSEDVIRYIAARREWTKMYGIKVSLCRNPKAPIAETTRLLPFLRDKDLQNIVKSKGVPSAVVAQARKLMMQRRGGGK